VKADAALFATLAKAKQDALIQGLTGLVDDADKTEVAPAPKAKRAPAAKKAPAKRKAPAKKKK
jgi:hypothetical protein